MFLIQMIILRGFILNSVINVAGALEDIKLTNGDFKLILVDGHDIFMEGFKYQSTDKTKKIWQLQIKLQSEECILFHFEGYLKCLKNIQLVFDLMHKSATSVITLEAYSFVVFSAAKMDIILANNMYEDVQAQKWKDYVNIANHTSVNGMGKFTQIKGLNP